MQTSFTNSLDCNGFELYICLVYACSFVFQGGLVFVCGNTNGLMQVLDRRHNTDDIIATVLAVEPMKFIYRGR